MTQVNAEPRLEILKTIREGIAWKAPEDKALVVAPIEMNFAEYMVYEECLAEMCGYNMWITESEDSDYRNKADFKTWVTQENLGALKTYEGWEAISHPWMKTRATTMDQMTAGYANYKKVENKPSEEVEEPKEPLN